MQDESHADLIREGVRILTVCNACRYCEGYCAVFPALELRSDFSASDLNYLANLCHNCAECYYACQYAPPHEFAVNVPKTLAEIRLRSYRQFAWPQALGTAFRGAGATAAVMFIAAFALWMVISKPGVVGQFYSVISHRTMVAVFGAAAFLVLVAVLMSLMRFLQESAEGGASLFALAQGLKDALQLTYLHGGGQGCTYPREQRSLARWWFHQFTLYGFLLCFASTSVAAVYHYALGRRAPYEYFSLPVVLGTLGGVGLLIGPAGLFYLKQRQDSATRDSNQDGMDFTFIALLFFTSATGILLLALRETLAMPQLLAIHLGSVLALFLTLPYGKFVHAIYRSAALVRYALERSRAKGGHAVEQ